jgi:hypothetical protein
MPDFATISPLVTAAATAAQAALLRRAARARVEEDGPAPAIVPVEPKDAPSGADANAPRAALSELPARPPVPPDAGRRLSGDLEAIRAIARDGDAASLPLGRPKG